LPDGASITAQRRASSQEGDTAAHLNEFITARTQLFSASLQQEMKE
jgi:hypothetical protein